MSKRLADRVEVVSARAYGVILSSPRLRQQLLPKGLACSPYRILDYDHTLTLHDPDGIEASYSRSQRVLFQQDGVSAVLDHAWSDGILTEYESSAGPVVDTIKDDGRRHLVIELPRSMATGEAFAFDVDKTEMEAFLGRREWVEVILDHPVEYLRQAIIFPQERPPEQAVLSGDGKPRPLRSIKLVGGQTLVQAVIPNPKPHIAYRIDWIW